MCEVSDEHEWQKTNSNLILNNSTAILIIFS